MANRTKKIGIFIAVILVMSTGLTIVVMGAPEADEKAPPCTSNLTGFVDPYWNALFQYDVETPTGDNRCLGVEFDGTFFWISGGGDDATETNKLHKFDKNGNYITSYDQPNASFWGWRDLVWDGQYLYGSESTDIEQIDPSTGSITGVTIPGPQDPNRGLAYDPATDHFWTANFNSDIYEIDRAGGHNKSIPQPRISEHLRLSVG
ncbi:MAG TPA: hypothetical protein VMW67_04305 [Desulfobacteria bacterium]|nr:hypothetical protein [Desulfobacteria bacterium]